MSASKYRVELTESQKRRLSEVAHRGKSPARTVKRALALLKPESTEESWNLFRSVGEGRGKVAVRV